MGCNSLLYYPSRAKFVNPEKLPRPPREIVYYSHQHEHLVAWHFQTPHTSKGVFVVFHGNAQNLSSHFYSMYWVLEKGYDLFIFDYPGYGASTGDPTPRNTVDAGVLAIQYAQKEWPQLPIIVVGQSIGGAIALRSVIDLKDRKSLCAVVADSTFASYKKAGQKVMASTWFTWPFQYLSYVFISDEFSPKDRLKDLSPLPLVVIHRKTDPVIPWALGQELYEDLPAPKSFFWFDGEGHVNAFTGDDRVENQRNFLAALPPECSR